MNDWKQNFFKDRKKRIASIPFMRNLIEYTIGPTDPDYKTLTSLLHWKANSTAITQSDLDDIYNKLFMTSEAYSDTEMSVVDLIESEAEECLKSPTGVNFENKIVLAIAIRLAAERFMSDKIVNPGAVEAIEENQTQKLLKQFQVVYSGDNGTIKTLRSVVLMTPENIHLNAFMYEPILDMSDEHLRKLYKDVSVLK